MSQLGQPGREEGFQGDFITGPVPEGLESGESAAAGDSGDSAGMPVFRGSSVAAGLLTPNLDLNAEADEPELLMRELRRFALQRATLHWRIVADHAHRAIADLSHANDARRG